MSQRLLSHPSSWEGGPWAPASARPFLFIATQSLLHHVKRRRLAGPQLELLGRLREEHDQTIEPVAAGGACFAKEARLARTGHEVVGETRAAELPHRRRRFVLIF